MINLFINYFDHSNSARKKEIEFCLEKNQENEYLHKIIIVNRNERATYGDFFRAMKAYPKDINIIANADIYFDKTIQKADNIKQFQCYALTRWEDVNGTIMDFNQRHGRPSPPQWSQDTWIFRGSTTPEFYDNVKAIRSKKHREMIPFSLGIPGCDNKIAALLKEKGFIVTNPSLSIKAIHKHLNPSRDYPDYQILEGIKPAGMVNQTAL